MISVIVLTDNDEKILEYTVKHLTWCDEIIVIDDGSDDGTVSIASRYTDKIYKRELKGDYASQRNFGLSKARGDWILFVDSDEIVSQNLSLEIKSVISPDNAGSTGYLLRRRDYFL